MEVVEYLTRITVSQRAELLLYNAAGQSRNKKLTLNGSAPYINRIVAELSQLNEQEQRSIQYPLTTELGEVSAVVVRCSVYDELYNEHRQMWQDNSMARIIADEEYRRLADADKRVKQAELLEKLLAYPIPPNLIIDTGYYGYESYWFSDKPLNVGAMARYSEEIADRIGIINVIPSQLRGDRKRTELMVPGFKSFASGKSLSVEVIHSCPDVYDIEAVLMDLNGSTKPNEHHITLAKAKEYKNIRRDTDDNNSYNRELPDDTDDNNINVDDIVAEWTNINIAPALKKLQEKHGWAEPLSQDRHDNNINLLRNKEFDVVRDRLAREQLDVTTNHEIYNILARQDMREFLGVGEGRFNCCICHSGIATVGINPESSVQHYICNNIGCLANGRTIVALMMLLTGLQKNKALNALKDIYKLEYQLWDFQQELMEVLESNIKLLSDGQQLAEKYPNLNKLAGRYTPLLITLHEETKLNLCQEQYWRDGKFYGFTSMRYLADQSGKSDASYINKKLNLLAHLGLIIKEGKLPKGMYARAKGYGAQANHFTATYYTLPLYNDELMAAAEIKAKEFKDNGGTMAGLNRAMLRNFQGMDEHHRCFPQMVNQPISTLHEDAQNFLSDIALMMLSIEGYIREEEVLKRFKEQYRGPYSFAHTQLKTILPKLLIQYSLRKVKINKHFKELHGIQEAGYFNVYVWDDAS